MENELWIYDVIGQGWEESGITAESVRDHLSEIEGDLTVRLNSPGGDVFEAVAIKSLLDRYEGTVKAIVDGLSASASTIIQMAADTVEMADGAMMMIHEPWGATVGDEKDHIAQASALGGIGRNLAEMYAARGQETPDHFRSLMRAETWLTAEESLALGLADTVSASEAKDYKVPREFGYKNVPAKYAKHLGLRNPVGKWTRNGLSSRAMRRKIDLTRRAARL